MNYQFSPDPATEVVKLLSAYGIPGAEYNSRARDPPPLCHPGTRVQLRQKIIAWFHKKGREKALLWLSGPAGVGKSAVIQTVAESLAESRFLGAALFFSRPNNRRDPQRVFTAIASQLIVKIPTYRIYITERVALDPSLLQKGMEEQFQIFITEPFGLKKLEVGGSAIFLDGLDECGENDDQRKIIRLISEFVLHFPRSPLVWIIASRAEPHIASTFAEETIATNHWSEYISIGSTEACRDVERYLGAELVNIGKIYAFGPMEQSQILEQSPLLLGLVDYASGFFLLAVVAAGYIDDPSYADPLKRLNQVISFLNHSPQGDDNPFALLDTMYTNILRAVLSTSWAATRRILGFVLCTRGARPLGPSFQLQSHTLAAMSTILDLEESAIYHYLHQLHSVLEIPPQKLAHDSGVLFLHDSFADYLTNPARSGEYFVDIGECVGDIVHCLYRVFLRKPWDCEPNALAQSGIEPDTFYQNLKFDAEAGFYYTVTGDHKTAQQRGPFVSPQVRSECLDVLSQITTSELGFSPTWASKFNKWLFALWKDFPEELEERKLVKEAWLRDLKFDHLDWRRNRPAFVNKYNYFWSPDSASTLEKFIAELRSLQEDSPKTKVLICGSTPERRSLFFSCGYQERVNDKLVSLDRYYCIPYPY